MRQVAADPEGPRMRKRPDLGSGIHSFHVKYAWGSANTAKVKAASAQVLYYRIVQDAIEIVLVPHERMEPKSSSRRVAGRRLRLICTRS